MNKVLDNLTLRRQRKARHTIENKVYHILICCKINCDHLSKRIAENTNNGKNWIILAEYIAERQYDKHRFSGWKDESVLNLRIDLIF